MTTPPLCSPEQERHVLHLLAEQWKLEVGVLQTGLCQLLKPPVFAFSNMKHAWASWNSAAHQMTFSRQLFAYPWASFRAVLRHELAHQIADAIGGLKETAHGRSFAAACDMLKCEARASCDHPGFEREQPSQEEQARTRRIKKLLALAGSSNENEAVSALSKARQQIRTYHIDLLKHHDKHFVSKTIGQFKGRHPRYINTLAALLQEHCFVRALWVRFPNPKGGNDYTILELSGLPEDLQWAEYVYYFVLNNMEHIWPQFRHLNNLPAKYKKDFATGLIRGFSAKLRQQNSKSVESGDEHALMALGSQKLNNYMEDRYPRTKKRSNRCMGNQGVIDAGHAHGKKLQLHKPLNNKANNGHLLDQ